MNFSDQGIIIFKKPLKENAAILTVFTSNHGMYSGVLKQYSKKTGDSLVEGNLIDFLWSARLHEHIGTVKCELIKSYNAFILNNKTKLYAFNSIVSLIKCAFHEREPHNRFFPILHDYLENSKQAFSFAKYIKLELEILAESGYQLQLNSCIATGSTDNLVYVSPKSGCAVSKKAGLPYAEKLLTLPNFLTSLNISTDEIDEIQKRQALNLTSYFLERYILQKPREDLESRSRFINHILK